MRKMSTFLLALALAIPQGGQAEDAERSYLIMGEGIHSCSTVKGGDRLPLITLVWLQGALTAVNITLPQTYSLVETITVAERWILDYCRLNPHKIIAQAFVAFLTDPTVYAARVVRAPAVQRPVLQAPQPAPDAARGITLITLVQHRLQLAGYNPGYADGIFGLKTRQALEQYQAANGLKVTGEINDATLFLLGIPGIEGR